MNPRLRVPLFRGDSEPLAHRGVVVSYLVMLLFMLTACSAKAKLNQDLNRAEQTWQAQGIESYTIEVREINSIWHAQTQVITVVDGIPIEASATCIPAPFEGDSCEVEEFDPVEFTVDALFERARTEAAHRADYLTIAFDETYGYPASMGYNHPDILDEDWAISVVNFQPLP